MIYFSLYFLFFAAFGGWFFAPFFARFAGVYFF